MSTAVLSKSPRELRTAREEHCSSHRDSLPSEHNMVTKRRGDSRASKHGKGLRLFLRSTSIRAQSLMTVILKTASRGPRQLSPHAQYELTNKNIRPLEQSTGKVSPGSIRAFKQRHQASRIINGEGLGGLNTSPRAKTSGHSNSPRSSVVAIRALKSAITLTDRCSRAQKTLV